MGLPVPGAGYLLANDILTDIAFALFQPSVNLTVPVGGLRFGQVTVPLWDPSIYLGAQLAVGAVGIDLESVTVTGVTPGVNFTVTFLNYHEVGEPILGATFPVRQLTDPLDRKSVV